VKPVLDGEVLEVAQPGIDLAERLIGMKVARGARFPRKSGALRGLDDELGKPLAPPPVEPVGDGVLVDQLLELRRARQLALDQRRR
jgi:hypothetical protein